MPGATILALGYARAADIHQSITDARSPLIICIFHRNLLFWYSNPNEELQ